jgi:cytoskeletal protein RodZ
MQSSLLLGRDERQEAPTIMDIGAQLRQARESRGLSVATLAATTRIHARVLEGIERNDLSVIPPRPYARGFVAAFAREVGLNSDQVVRDYFAQFDEAPPVEPPTPPFTVASGQGWRWRGWLTGVAVLAVLAAVGALLSRTEAPRGDPGIVGTSGIDAASGDREATAAASRQQPAGTPALPDAQAGRAGAESGSVVVILETAGAAWVDATADGKRQVYQLLPPGTKTTLRATRDVVIRVGDAGAVRWSVNGRQPQPMGRPGEVRTVRITPQGAVNVR